MYDPWRLSLSLENVHEFVRVFSLSSHTMLFENYYEGEEYLTSELNVKGVHFRHNGQ